MVVVREGGGGVQGEVREGEGISTEVCVEGK